MIGVGWREFAATADVAFLLGFPSLFSIINPIGAALIFDGITKDFSRGDRVKVAGRVGFYSLLIMLGALWGGAYVLNFFGVSLDALRIAGGTVVAVSGWRLLTSGDQTADPNKGERHVAAEDTARDPLQLAFFPLTLPFTTGPGTIAVGDHARRGAAAKRRRPLCLLSRCQPRRRRQRGDRLDRLSLLRPRDQPPGRLGAAGHRAAVGVPSDVHRRADSRDRDGRAGHEIAGDLGEERFRC